MKKYEHNYGKNPEGVLSTTSGYATETTNFGEAAFGILNKSTRDKSNFTTPEVVSSSTATLFSVGNGSNGIRKNIIELKADGTVLISGIGEYDGTNPDDATGIADKMQGVEDSVDGLEEAIDSINIVKDETNDLVYTLMVGGEERGSINIPKDQFLKSVTYNEDTNELIFTFVTSESDNQEVRVNMTDLVDTYTAGDGLNLEGGQFSVKVDADTQSYIEVTANGVKIIGINEALDKKVSWDESKKVITLPADGSISALRNNGLEVGVLVCQRTYDEGATYVTEVGTTKNSLTLNSTERPQIDFADGASENIAYQSEITDIRSSLDDYLPLSGGTMTGNITFESAPDSNGHEYVDLGLPSGNLWAKYNIGADSKEEGGLYFQWGDTQGYTAEQVGYGEGLKAFRSDDYKFSIDGSASNLSKYNASDSKTVLEPEDDAAHVLMGGNWRMPTFEECKELCFNTDIYLVPTEGEEIQGTAQEQSDGSIKISWASPVEGTLKGVKFYKKGDKQTYMFVPASGVADIGSVANVGKSGYLWASSLNSSRVQFAWYFNFNAYEGCIRSGVYRFYGLPVRGILPSNTENSKDTIINSKGIIIEGKTESDLLNAAGSTTTIQSILDLVPEPDLSPLQNAIGNNTYEGSNYLTKETNLTDAVIQLDEEIKATNDNLALEHANAEAAYAKKTELEGYLPLTGGEITGAISVPRMAFTHGSSGMMVDMQSNANDFQIRTTNAGMKSVTFTIQNTPILKLTEGGIYENGTLLENKYALLTDLPNVVTTSANGLMSSADKTKLDSINLSGIQVVTALPDTPDENTMYIVVPA